MTEAITRAHATLGAYANINGRPNQPSLLTLVASPEWQCTATLNYLNDLISQLQAAKSAYEKRIERDALLSIDEPDAPLRELRDRPAPNPYDAIKIKHDSPLGYRFVNRCDFDPSTMELVNHE